MNYQIKFYFKRPDKDKVSPNGIAVLKFDSEPTEEQIIETIEKDSEVKVVKIISVLPLKNLKS